MLKFDKTVVNWGSLPHSAGKVNFTFNLEEGQVFALRPDCAGCTFVRLSADGKRVEGNIDIAKAASAPKNGPINVTKIIYVWENDGQPWFEVDPETKIRKTVKKSLNLEIKFTVTP